MKICLVSREFRPFRGGGIGTYARTFSSALAAAGHAVTVLTIAHPGEPEDAREGHLRVVRVPFMDGDDWSRPYGGADEAGRAIFNSRGPFAFLSRQFAFRIRDLERGGAFDAIEFPDTGALGWFTLASLHAGEAVTRAQFQQHQRVGLGRGLVGGARAVEHAVQGAAAQGLEGDRPSRRSCASR